MTNDPRFLTAWQRRSAIGLTCVSAILITLLSACGGGSGGGIAVPAAPNVVGVVPVAPVGEAALTASTPGMLLDYFKQKIKEQPALVGSGAGLVRTDALSTPVVAAAAPVGPDVGGNNSPAAFAGTTLQETGVDENDWIKTDGSILYGLTASYYANSGIAPATVTLPQLQAQRRLADGQLAPLARITLNNELSYSGMYLVSGAKRLALVGEKSVSIGLPTPINFPLTPTVSGTGAASAGVVVAAPPMSTALPNQSSLPPPPNVFQRTIGIDVVSTPEPNASVAGSLSVTHNIRLDGRLLGTRVIGNTLYVVSNWQPYLNRYVIPSTATVAQANEIVASLSSAEILPKIQINNSPAEPLLADSDCYVQAANASAGLEMTTITAFDLSSASLQRSSRCFLGGNQAMYMSAGAVYLASSRYLSSPVNSTGLLLPSNAKTDIHKFALIGQTISYRGSGEVAGHFGWDSDKNAYRMSEFEGDLRVITFTGQQGWGPLVNVSSPSTVAGKTATLPTPSPATLSVLRETAGKLQTVGTLPNANRPAAIGKPGEQIFAVKFIGPRAYVVTFRRTDPLYVLDLSNPADPKTVGELEIPGYSDYLFPVGDGLLLGVG